jgi:type VI secretion system protein ImpC
VEGLPLHQFLNPEGDFAMRSPIQTPISDRTENELANQGFIPLVQEHNKDSAAFFSVVSCRKPPVFRDDEANRNARRAIELPYTLMVCRFAQYMKILMRNKIGSAMSKDHVQRYLESWINDYVLLMDDASAEVRAQRPLREARIEVEDDTDLPGCYRVVMFLRPHLVPDELTIFLRTVVTLPQRH